MEKKLGSYSIVASLVTSVVMVLLFYLLALQKLSERPDIYKPVDVYAGMVYVFILSMIVSASIWPGIIEKNGMKVHLAKDKKQASRGKCHNSRGGLYRDDP
ncbi:hypothetical protein ig2599ANME_1212 [groundwater metagenome]